MKVVSTIGIDKWGTFKRVYTSQSAIEKHMIAFIENKVIPIADKEIDRVITIINREVTAFCRYYRGKMGTLTIQKEVACEMKWDPSKRSYRITLRRPNRFPFFEISEPIP